jgi:urease accessory protein
MAIRRAGDRVLVVGSAAAPGGGDELTLDVVVGPASRLSLGTVAATMAWPGPHDSWSTQAVTATVGAGGHLCWTPEPMVAVAGCRHRSSMTVRLAADATAWIVEEVSLGRTGEDPGCIELEWRVERAGSVLLHHAERLGPNGPGWGSAVSSGRHRHLVAAVSVGVTAPGGAPTTVVGADAAAARLQIADDTWMALAVGVDRPAARGALDAVADPGAPGLDVAETVRAQVGR